MAKVRHPGWRDDATPEMIRRMVDAREAGASLDQIAHRFNRCQAWVRKYLMQPPNSSTRHDPTQAAA